MQSKSDETRKPHTEEGWFSAWVIHISTGGTRVFSWGGAVIVVRVTQKAKTTFQLSWLLLNCLFVDLPIVAMVMYIFLVLYIIYSIAACLSYFTEVVFDEEPRSSTRVT